MTIEEKLQKLAEIKNPGLKMQKILTDAEIAKAILAMGQLQGVKGDDGYTPVKGKDYFTDQEIGDIVEYIQSQIRDGKDGLQGMPGKDGKDGETPVRLIDYWTPEDQIKIVNEVLKKVPKPEKVVIDESKIVTKAISELEKIHPNRDFVTTKQLTDFLRSGGFHGGGLSNITGLITAGTNVTITGTGQTGDPYVINSTASGSIGGTIAANQIGYGSALNTLTSDVAATRNATTFATLLGMPQNAGVDRAFLQIDDDLLNVAGTNGVILGRNDFAGAVGSTIIGIIDGTPLGAPSAYTGILRADDTVTGEFFLQFFFAGTGGMSAGDGTDNGIMQIGIGSADLGADNQDGGGNDTVSIQVELNGGGGAQYLRGAYGDVTNDYGWQIANDGITFDFDNFNGTPGTFYTFPTADGSNGEVLTTDGAGNLSFAAIPPASAALTATYIGFGDGSNVLTGDSQLTYNSTYSFIKHTVPANSDSLTYGAASFSGSGLDDFTLTWNSGVYFSNKYGGNLVITIDGTGTPDTFSWSFTGSYSQIIGSGSNIPITGLQQQLQDNFGGNVIAQVQFTATTGHTLSDQWTASTSLGGNQKGYNLADTYGHEQFEVEPNGGTYSLGDDGTNGGTSWWGNGTQLLISDGNGELGLFAPRHLRFEHPTPGTYTAALVDMQSQIWANYGDFRVLDSATSSVWFRVNTASRNINIGDVQSAGNDTLFTIDDNTATMTGTLDGIFTLQAVLGSDFFTLNTTTGNVRLGDISGALNSTNFFIDDQNSEIKGFLDGEFFVADSLSNRMLSVDTTTLVGVLGDVDTVGNGVRVTTDDTNFLFSFNTGVIRGNNFHNNGSVSQGSATEQDVRSGTYTPTLTGVNNVTSTTSRKAQWMRVGNVVTVSGQFDVTPTGTGLTVVGISLPVASNFGTAYEAGGAGHAPTVAGHGAAIYADATNNRAELSYVDTVGSADTMTYTFTYEVI